MVYRLVILVLLWLLVLDDVVIASLILLGNPFSLFYTVDKLNVGYLYVDDSSKQME
jgi:1,4-dihydroxy-2-naphthoate octaprenyltransferase